MDNPEVIASPDGVALPEAVADALDDYNSLLRSFASVADRNGEQTNWDALRSRVHGILDQHHSTWLKFSSFRRRYGLLVALADAPTPPPISPLQPTPPAEGGVKP